MHLVIAVVCSQGLGKPKVADLGETLADQQDVASCQISVHKVLLLQILHSHGDLVHQLDDILHRYSISVGTNTSTIEIILNVVIVSFLAFTMSGNKTIPFEL